MGVGGRPAWVAGGMARPEHQSELHLRRASGSSLVSRASCHAAVSAQLGSWRQGGRWGCRALWSWCSWRRADSPSERGPLQLGGHRLHP